MKVLIAVASRHGSTMDIAQVIADELEAVHLTVNVTDIEDITALEGYDAVVLGSAVYAGNWLSSARDFIKKHGAELARVPVWLFSSGPIGTETAGRSTDPRHLDTYMEATHAREHHVFAGELDPKTLGFTERLIMKIVHAPSGDFRDWEAIRAWAQEIGTALVPAQA